LLYRLPWIAARRERYPCPSCHLRVPTRATVGRVPITSSPAWGSEAERLRILDPEQLRATHQQRRLEGHRQLHRGHEPRGSRDRARRQRRRRSRRPPPSRRRTAWSGSPVRSTWRVSFRTRAWRLKPCCS
jgi:hypothetical protein